MVDQTILATAHSDSAPSIKSSAAGVPSGAAGKDRMIDGFQDAFVATANRVRQLNVDQVPGHIAGFHLGFDFRQAAIVVFREDLVAGPWQSMACD